MGSRRIAVESWLQLRRANHSGGTCDPQRGTTCCSVEALFFFFMYLPAYFMHILVSPGAATPDRHIPRPCLVFLERKKMTKPSSCTCPECVTRDVILMKHPVLTVMEQQRCRRKHAGQCERGFHLS